MKRPKSKKKQLKRQLKLKGINPAVKPTEQDIKIAQNRAAGMKKGEALIAAGISPENAHSNSAEIYARPGVRAALAMAFEEAGVGVKKIAQVLNEGLSATKVISANLLMLGEKETPEVIDATERASEENETLQKVFIRVEDFAERRQTARLASELLDLFPSERQPAGGDIDPNEEASLIKQAEDAAGKRDISRYTVIREHV